METSPRSALPCARQNQREGGLRQRRTAEQSCAMVNELSFRMLKPTRRGLWIQKAGMVAFSCSEPMRRTAHPIPVSLAYAVKLFVPGLQRSCFLPGLPLISVATPCMSGTIEHLSDDQFAGVPIPEQ
jgi:hypothetical protein